ncbi:MAG: DUF4870 domain-containing protein [Candidatus Omnitrophica bacterium]|nr:DUF4870 domain-containing protein [Candidatus Omnitrophota bacterium]
MKHVSQGKSSLGMEANIAAVLSYLFGFITGLIFYILEKENKFVRFHALQSIIVFGFLFMAGVVAGFLPLVGFRIITLVGIIEIILWIILMIKAYQGEYLELPIIGEFARKKS